MQLNRLDINIYSHFSQTINRYMELEKCEEEEKVNTAILHVQYAITDINSQIEIFNSDAPQLSVYYQTMIKTDFLINVVETLYKIFFNINTKKYIWKRKYSKIKKFRLNRSLTLAHPLETTYYSELGYGKKNDKWCEDIQPKNHMFNIIYKDLQHADYIMFIKEKGRQDTTRVPICVQDDILSVAEIALKRLEYFTKELEKKLVLSVEKMKNKSIPVSEDMDIQEYIQIILSELETRYPNVIEKIEYEDGRKETYCTLIEASKMLAYVFDDREKEEKYGQYKREIREAVYYYGQCVQNMNLEETEAEERLSSILRPSASVLIEKSKDEQANYKHEKIEKYLSMSNERSFDTAMRKLNELSYDGCKIEDTCTHAEWGLIQLWEIKEEFTPYFSIDFNTTDKKIYYQYLTALYFANKNLK